MSIAAQREVKYQYQTTSRLGYQFSKMLVFDGANIIHSIINKLPRYLGNNTAIVVNDASTIPASFHGYTSTGMKVELRLVFNKSKKFDGKKYWRCIIYQDGNWQDKTENRKPASLMEGDTLHFGELMAEIIASYPISDRLYDVQFIGEDEDIWKNLIANGKPIQYSYHERDLKLWDIQTIFSSHTVSLEAASASFQFDWQLLKQLQKKGISIIPITHATSISSTGDQQLDKYLPFPERYRITKLSARKLHHVKEEGKRILAIGTSVTRALEDNFRKYGEITDGTFQTDLVISNQYRRQFVDDLFTGMHLPEESHLQLLENFVDSEFLTRGYQAAIDHNYLWHEYGDVNLIINQN